MIQIKISNRMILVSLLFLVLMSQIIDVSAVTSIEFSDEKKVIFGHSRVLFGYNASLLNKEGDVNISFWVILEDKGEYDVVWETVRVDYDIKDLSEHKEDNSSVLLVKELKFEKTMLIETAYENLTEENLHFKIKFSFIEYDDDKETKNYSFRKNWEEILGMRIGAYFIIPMICVLSLVGVFRRKSRNS